MTELNLILLKKEKKKRSTHFSNRRSIRQLNYRKRIVTHFRFVATYQSYVSTMYHDDCRFCNNPELRILVQVFDVYSDENMCFLTSFFFSLFVSLYFTEFILDNLWRVIFFLSIYLDFFFDQSPLILPFDASSLWP